MYLVWLCLLVSPPLQAQYSEQNLLREANELFEQGKYGDAMPKYAQLLSLNPTSPELNYKFGATSLYGDASKKADASKYLKFAAEKPGTDPLVWFFLGRAYHLNYQFADAIKAYQKYQSLASGREVAARQIDLRIEACQNGTNLLSNIKEVVVLDKKQSQADFFFRLYDLSDIGGKILVTPEELLSSADKKRGHKSLIHFRGIGTTVYFSSYGKDEKNGLDIYQAEVLPNGVFSTPVPVSGGVNTPFDEDYPFLHPDNKTFYFSSTGHNSMGGYDVFKSAFSQSTGVFSKPENLDFAVNTPDDDIFYIADSLNRLANFASARSSRQGEMHVYKVEVTSLPLELTLLKGNFANRIDEANRAAKITVINAATNKEVDVQYTDPGNGDYVLSFPNSGKYKFLVEAKNSDMIHSGLVDVPKSDGVSAYIQEMELVTSAGVEKLLINNLFDQEFEGDISSLLQDLLRRKAALEINFNEVERPEEIEETVVPDLFVNAYNDAGFGAGLSNEKVLEQAEQRVSEYANAKAETANLIAQAVALSGLSEAEAMDQLTKAEAKQKEAKGLTGAEADKAMFEAAVAKFKAERAVQASENARSLEAKLVKIEKEQDSKYTTARQQVDSLEDAINSGEYERALGALEREAQVRESLDKVSDRFDPLGEVRASGIEAQKDAKRKMESAISMREEAEVLEGQWLTKKRQREKLSGKQADKLDQEIEILAADISDLRAAAARAFDGAEAYQTAAQNEIDQYEMLAGIMSGTTPETTDTANRSAPSTQEARAAVLGRIEALSPKQEAVARHIAANPTLSSVFETEQAQLAFKKAYAPDETGALLADGDIAQLENTDGQIVEAQPLNDEISKNSGNSSGGASKVEAPSSGVDTSKPTGNQGTEKEDVILANEEQVPGLNQTNATTRANEIPSKVISEDQKETPGMTESSLSPAMAESTLPQPGSPQAEQRIRAEQVRIEAAEDWISIIDDSIQELQAGMGGDETNEEDLQAQLDQYRSLKAEKMAEVEKSNALIADLSQESIGYNAMQSAENDIDTLDASFVARLESKMNEVNVQGGYVANIKSIDRDYLSEMASIELSGKSAPEMAAERIALNESFISQLDKVISREVFAEITPTDALELRRIKTLEVQMDREVLEGTMAFKPRTAQAIEYDALLAGAPGNDTKQKASALDGLPPAIRTSLSQPYSRESLSKGYESDLARAASKSSSGDQANARIKTNESFLATLDKEIALFADAVAAHDGAIPSELNDRYQLLLIDKSNVENQLNVDRAALLAESTVAAPISTSATAQEFEIPNTDFQAIAMERLAAVEGQNLPKQDDLLEKAKVNRLLNAEINREIESLMPLMDATTDDKIRDQIQIRIQQLDAIAADKLQEADRLEAEAETTDAILEKQLLAEGSKPSMDTGLIELGEGQTISPDDLNFSIDQSPDYQAVAYKSLNANIQYSEIQASIDSANSYRSRARDVLEEFNSSDDAAQRKALYDEFTVLSRKITAIDQVVNEEIAKSNTTEIDFYSDASTNLLSQLESEDLSPEDRERLKSEAAAISATKDKLEQNARLIENLDPSETASRAALIRDDRALIADLNKSYTTISDINAALRVSEDTLASATPEIAENTAIPAGVDPNLPTSTEILDSSESVEATSQLIPGKAYTTAVTQERIEQLSPQEVAAIAARNPELSKGIAIPSESETGAWEPIISAMTPIDAQGVMILKESLEKFELLTSVLAADTLQALEKSKADFAKRIEASALGQMTEASRLRDMVKYQSNQGDKDFLIEKAARLESQAEVSYQQAAIAASQAEEIRAERIKQEQRIAASMKKLDQEDLSELTAFVDLPSYSVVSVDLTSSKPSATASTTTRTGRRPGQDTEPVPVSVTKDESDSVTNPSTADNRIETEARTADSVAEAIPLSPNKGSANWLALVEIVAEKKSFSDVTETMFVSADKSVYSRSNPIPIDPEMPSGLIFQVQVGAFRNPISQELFGEFAPIMGQRLDNGIIRYRAGIFKQYKEAVVARNAIRGKGYSDAFVVAYLNGEKLTGAQAEQILAQARLAENFTAGDETALSTSAKQQSTVSIQSASAEYQKVASTAAEKTAYYNDPEAAVATQVEIVSGLFYTVQVGVYSKPVKLEDLYNLSNLNSELTSGGMIRYTTGRYSSVADASSSKQAAINAGVTDAFVTAYNDGVRIGLQEAASILAEKGRAALSGSAESDAPSTSSRYVVFMGEFGKDIPQDLANIFLERADLGVRRIDSGSGKGSYISTDFPSLDEANSHLASCIEAGIEQAVVMRLVDGRILPLTGK